MVIDLHARLSFAVDLIKEFEGIHDGDRSTPILEPERDPIGIWTLGWGSILDFHGRPVTANTPGITIEQAEQLLMREILAKSRALNRYVDIWLPDKSFSALVSFSYNLGVGAFRASTLRRRVNSGAFWDVPHQFSRWNKAGGRVLKGLIRRRSAEADLFMTGLDEDGYVVWSQNYLTGS